MKLNYTKTIKIYPFCYKEDFKLEEVPSYFKQTSLSRSKLYNHIQDILFLQDNKDYEPQLTIFEFESNKITEFNKQINNPKTLLNMNYPYTMYQPNRKDPSIVSNVSNFNIESIFLILGKNNIGFLILQFDVNSFTKSQSFDAMMEAKKSKESLTTEDFKSASYYLRKFSYKQFEIAITKKVGKEEYKLLPIQFEELCMNFLMDIPIKTFFEKEHNNEHVLSYTFAHIKNEDSDDTTLCKIASNLATSLSHGYKESYKIPPYRLDFEHYPYLYRPFDNSFWSVANEGLAQVFFETEDETTNHFFSNNMKGEFTGVYFAIYIFVLYQHYSLLNLSMEANEILHKIRKSSMEKTSEIVGNFHDRIIDFRLESSFKQISYTTHHNELYECLRKRLNIDILHEELENEINALHQVVQAKYQKQLELAERNKIEIEKEQREEDEKKQKDMNATFTILSVVYFPLTLIAGIYGMNVSVMSSLTIVQDIIFVLLVFIGNLLLFYNLKSFIKIKS